MRSFLRGGYSSRRLFLSITFVFFLFSNVFSQFTITETFMSGSYPNMVLSDDAKFTSGIEDPAGAGWLRLTPSTENRKGVAYLDQAFPSANGMILEFEYKTWRDAYDYQGGGDGFCVFLFDASITNFATGGVGASLGYAINTTVTPIVPTGLTGGYIGIGFDEFGNFCRQMEGMGTGITGATQPNTITFRGPTTTNPITSNRYLTHTQLQANPQSNVNSIDYNQTTTTRPTDAQFYRKVKITFMPTGTGFYDITVFWKLSPTGSYTQLLTYRTTDVPPANFKLGFTSSTGGAFNYHEIRNMTATTASNLRVTKQVDKTAANVGEQLTYTIDVLNETGVDLNNIVLNDILSDGAGNPLTNQFTVNSITFDNNGYTGNTASGFVNGIPVLTGFTNPLNPISLNLEATSTSTFTIVGTINSAPATRFIANKATIDASASGFIDDDLSNDTTIASTQVTGLFVTSNAPLCEGENLQFQLHNTLPSATFNWSGPNGYTSTLASPTLTNVTTANTGRYTVVMTSTGGVTETVTHDVVINQRYNLQDASTICRSDLPYAYRDTTFNLGTASGRYTFHETTVNGCDSVVTLTLTVLPSASSQLTDTICGGESYSFGTRNLTQGGTYIDTFPTPNGCDSIVELTLVVLPKMDVTFEVPIICADEESFVVNLRVNNTTLPVDYSVVFDETGKSAGFTDISGRFSNGLYEITIVLPDSIYPSTYHATFTFTDINGCENNVFQVDFDVYYPSSIMIQMWDDVIALQNEKYNGGYVYHYQQWYRNGSLMPGETYEYLYLTSDTLTVGDYYMVDILRPDGTRMFSCPFYARVAKPLVSNFPIIFPTMQQKGGAITISATSEVQATLITMTGLVLRTKTIATTETIMLPNEVGVFLLQLVLPDGSTQTHKIISY